MAKVLKSIHLNFISLTTLNFLWRPKAISILLSFFFFLHLTCVVKEELLRDSLGVSRLRFELPYLIET